MDEYIQIEALDFFTSILNSIRCELQVDKYVTYTFIQVVVYFDRTRG